MILTRTMASGAALGVESYDRLFPNQDVLPSGGFGNLIALPLQLQARKLGNTEFLNDELDPHQDQWSYLASVPRIPPDLLGGSSPARRKTARWPSGRSLRTRRALAPAALAARASARRIDAGGVAATLADRLYIDRPGLPPALAHAIKRLATFSNPMFLELQRMRMSVARTPRVIGCFEDLDRHVAVPRGCLAEVEALLAEFDVRLDIQDERLTESRSRSSSRANSTTRNKAP